MVAARCKTHCPCTGKRKFSQRHSSDPVICVHHSLFMSWWSGVLPTFKGKIALLPLRNIWSIKPESHITHSAKPPKSMRVDCHSPKLMRDIDFVHHFFSPIILPGKIRYLHMSDVNASIHLHYSIPWIGSVLKKSFFVVVSCCQHCCCSPGRQHNLSQQATYKICVKSYVVTSFKVGG